MRQLRGNEMAMIFQEPMSSLNPVFTVGDQITEAVRQHLKVSKKEARDRAIESLRAGRHPDPGAARQAVPARAVGRHAPARDDRHGALVRAQAAHRRRADDGARRDDPGADPGAHQGDPGAHRHGRAAHHPRPRRGRRDGRRRRGHVRRPGRRAAAPSTEVLLQPRHPYTEGLLASIPSKGMRGQRLNVIKGTVPNPFNMPTGCNFAPRCPYRFEPCTHARPARRRGRRPAGRVLAVEAGARLSTVRAAQAPRPGCERRDVADGPRSTGGCAIDARRRRRARRRRADDRAPMTSASDGRRRPACAVPSATGRRRHSQRGRGEPHAATATAARRDQGPGQVLPDRRRRPAAPRRRRPGGRRRQLRRQQGRGLRPGRRVRLRQDHAGQDARPAAAADRRLGHARRRGHLRPRRART